MSRFPIPTHRCTRPPCHCLALWFLSLSALCGCDIKRPSGAYDGRKLEGPVIVAFDAGEGGLSTVEEGGVPEVPVIVPMEAGTNEAGQPTANPIDALQGDYLLRYDSETRVNDSTLGTVTTRSTTYGVMRVVRTAEDGLVGVERLCHSEVDQDASKGSVSTTISDRVWAALSPVQRTLSIDLAAGKWSSGPGTRRQGWKASASRMPTDVSTQRDQFLDPDEDGYPGVATRVQAQTSLSNATCTYDVVTFSITRMQDGTLSDGLLSGAQIVVEDSKTHALRVSGSVFCDTDDINNAPSPNIVRDSVRFARVAGGVLQTPDSCPDEATFRSALP